MDVRYWCYIKAEQGMQCSRPNTYHDHTGCIADAFAPTIERLVGLAQMIEDRRIYVLAELETGGREIADAARAALAELEEGE